MIRNTAPKSARSKRALESKDAKIVENVKSVLFVPGKTANQATHDITVDLSALKKPYMKRFQKKNAILPFEDATSVEFLSEKNDASIVVVSTNNKKRPNNLAFIRTFDFKVYDMIEFNVLSNFKLFQDFKKRTFQVGLKPMFVFNGHIFETHPTFIQIKSLFLDMFRGEITNLQDVAGLQSVIGVSAIEEDDHDKTMSALPIVHFRVYKVRTLKSAEPKLARIELDETGPRLDLKIGRVQAADPAAEKEAFRVPKQLQPKEKKNVSTDLMGDKVAKIHVGKQDLSKMQTRKMKGLKSKYDVVSDEEEGEDGDELADEISDDEEFVDAVSGEEEDAPAAKKRRI